MKGFTRGLVLKQRHKVTQKCPFNALDSGLSSLGAALARDIVLCFEPRQISSVADPDLELRGERGGGQGGRRFFFFFFGLPCRLFFLSATVFCFTQNKGRENPGLSPKSATDYSYSASRQP